MRRPPLPLVAILCVAAFQALAWSVLLPGLQGQDESSHFAYTQRIVETGEPTWTAIDDVPQERAFSTEVFAAETFTGLGPLALNVSARPYGTRLDERRWLREAAKLTDSDRGDGTFTSAMRNPPLYYVYEAAVYAPLEGENLLTRLFAMRWATVPFFLLAVGMAWLLAGEVFGRRRWLQATTALVVAIQPMLAQLGGVVNPDAMIAALWGVGLWLAARVVNRGATRGRALGAVGVVVLAALTHPRAAPVALALLAAFVVRAWPHVRARGAGARRAAIAALAAGGVLFVAASLVYTLRGDVTFGRVREFGSYLWQFYLPRPSFLTPSPGPEWGVRDVFVDRLWSGFVQLEINLAPGVLDAVWIATLVAAVGVLVLLVVRRDAVRARLGHAVVFAVALLALMASLHLAAWRDLPLFGDPIITGRYLTPLLPLAGLAVAAVAASLPRRLGPGAATLVLGLEALLALSALGTALVRFHG